MKICSHCGKEIINGVNGCMFMGNTCFDCGGQPQYYTPSIKFGGDVTQDEMNYSESLCMNNMDE